MLLFLMALPGAVPSAAAQCQYDVTWFDPVDCGPFGAIGVSVTGINAYGHLSGWYQNCNGLGDETPFIWTPEGGRQDLPLPANYPSGVALGLNNHGIVIGQALRENWSPYEIAIAWVDGELVEIGLLPGDIHAEAVAVNDAGLVIGNSYHGFNGMPRRGFTWQQGGPMEPIAHPDGQTTIVLEDVNASGVIAGWTWTPRRAMRVSDGQLEVFEPVPGGFGSLFSSINDRGWLSGHGQVENAEGGGWHWVAAGWRDDVARLLVQDPAVSYSFGGDLNRWGQIVGRASYPSPINIAAFIEDRGQITLLSDVAELPDALSDFGYPDAINDHGVIVMTGAVADPEGGVIVILTPSRPAGDATCDCRVGFRDLLAVLTDWGPAAIPMPTDLDRDGAIGLGDLLLVLEGWTTP